ncbi:MAG TPA: S53 family peptidase [Pseudonocardiaceae bacterium]|jgi:kumamolisin|nr:S53 family peptidase [Pseudonocardiaceae bacterium]
MTETPFVALAGSSRATLADVEDIGSVDPAERIGVTLVLRRRAELPTELVEGSQTLSQSEFAEAYGADPADVDLVVGVLNVAGIEVADISVGSRRISTTGPVSAFGDLFGATLRNVRGAAVPGGAAVEFRARSGELRVPVALDGVLVAVLGMDSRPQARAQYRTHKAKTAAATSYDPPTLATVYGFPANTDGTGHSVGIIELGGGFAQTDLDAYFQGLGIATPTVQAVSVDGAQNVAGQDPNGADGEVLLDIEVLGSLAPKATQSVYFGPNTDQGFIDAVSTAVHATPTPTAISISWGQSEDQWTAQSRTALDSAFADAAALGITVTVAAGDGGSADGQQDGNAHVDFPASSPHVLACGGTSLHASTTGTITSETVWNDGSSGGATGGGVSDTFPAPSWQATAGVPARSGGGTGRGVPDVAGDADPETGYNIRVDGNAVVIGGTSAVAPLWAALICRLSQSVGRPLGLVQTALYASSAAGKATTGFRDITSGNNGAYAAGPGWDACTGLGTPEGNALVQVLKS